MWNITELDLTFFIRIMIAAVCGALIGLERERRLKTAGMRTHIIVAISATLMIIVSKYGFFDVLNYSENLRVDASRVAAGVVQAIGFLGAGVIFVRKEKVSGVTTAAGLWATVGIGLAIGAGLLITGIISTMIILILQVLSHKTAKYFPVQFVGDLIMRLPISQFNVELLKKDFETARIIVRSMEMAKEDDTYYKVKVSVLFPKRYTEEQLMELFKSKPFIVKISYHHSA